MKIAMAQGSGPIDSQINDLENCEDDLTDYGGSPNRNDVEDGNQNQEYHSPSNMDNGSGSNVARVRSDFKNLSLKKQMNSEKKHLYDPHEPHSGSE